MWIDFSFVCYARFEYAFFPKKYDMTKEFMLNEKSEREGKNGCKRAFWEKSTLIPRLYVLDCF